MKLVEALNQADMAQVSYDGYTAIVVEDVFEGGYYLTIQHGGMPPHYGKQCPSLIDVEEEMSTTHCPHPINWETVEPEQS